VEHSGTKSALKASRLLFLLASKGKEREKKISNIERRILNFKVNFTKHISLFLTKKQISIFGITEKSKAFTAFESAINSLAEKVCLKCSKSTTDYKYFTVIVNEALLP
jgi:hypothetical protein